MELEKENPGLILKVRREKISGGANPPRLLRQVTGQGRDLFASRRVPPFSEGSQKPLAAKALQGKG